MGALVDLAEQVKQIGKQEGSESADDDRPTDELLVTSAVGTAHSRQEVVAVFLFIFSRPEHDHSRFAAAV